MFGAPIRLAPWIFFLLRRKVSRMARGTADPSAALGMTKEMAALPFGVMAVRTVSFQQPLSMEAPLYPLSSRAQPRDLQFRGPFLEMFSAALSNLYSA
jgi:hypothetical protein